MVAYIDAHKDGFAVEPICTVLQLPGSGAVAASRSIRPWTYR